MSSRSGSGSGSACLPACGRRLTGPRLRIREGVPGGAAGARPHRPHGPPYPTPSAATPSAERSVAVSRAWAVVRSGWGSAVFQA